jgi:hypothetical protein
MTRTSTGLLSAAILLFGAIVAGSQTAPTAPPTAPAPASDMPVTPETSAAAEQIAVGCLTRDSDGGFALTHVRLEDAAALRSSEANRTKPDTEDGRSAAASPVNPASAPVGTVGNVPARVRLVLEQGGADLNHHLGHTVQINGQLLTEAVSRTAGSAASSAASGSGVNAPRLTVHAVKPVSSTCTSGERPR